mmetsp:Transcript_47059/g.75815  ORF Transcript_47059/g.75815 Transcript_47059/m.75815 type:complete len:256 (-) Transcript_47059:20-787(-)
MRVASSRFRFPPIISSHHSPVRSLSPRTLRSSATSCAAFPAALLASPPRCTSLLPPASSLSSCISSALHPPSLLLGSMSRSVVGVGGLSKIGCGGGASSWPCNPLVTYRPAASFRPSTLSLPQHSGAVRSLGDASRNSVRSIAWSLRCARARSRQNRSAQPERRGACIAITATTVRCSMTGSSSRRRQMAACTPRMSSASLKTCLKKSSCGMGGSTSRAALRAAGGFDAACARRSIPVARASSTERQWQLPEMAI